MLNNDITDVLDETFTVLVDSFGTKKEIELIPGGARVEVTEENKAKYVDMIVKWELGGGDQLRSVLDGLYDIVPPYLLRESFTLEEFDLLINGRGDVSVVALKAVTWYDGGYESRAQGARRLKGKRATSSSNHTTIRLFWEAMELWDANMRGRLLGFCTGSTRLPLDGFSPPFTIIRGGEDSALPSSHTCFNQLVLPAYSSLDELQEKVAFAIQEGIGFHMT